ncbi:hypothetical protein GCM10027053_46370 [Intrasporangium mesophilum]
MSTTTTPIVLTQPEVSELLRVPVETLKYWRVQGFGPQSFRAGRHILYRAATVTTWIEEQEQAERDARSGRTE